MKNEHIDKIQNWFKQEGISIDPYTAFFHATEQVRLYFPHFNERIVKMINASQTYWCQVAQKDVSLLKNKTKSFIFGGNSFEALYWRQCYMASYSPKDIPTYQELII